MSLKPLQPGQVVDRFEVVGQVHKGGMATLWEVKALSDAPPFPLLMKTPILGDNDDPAAIVGFEQEQIIMPRLKGIHVPQFVAATDFSEQPCIVMERIDGPSLKARFDQAPLEWEEVQAIGHKVACALHALHVQNVIHFDLKPSNILFRPSGEAVLIDFGLSRHERLPDLLAEELRLPLGTGPYMSPEQVMFIRRDPRSDLFALGVMLYHLATGVRPFGHPTSERGLRKRLYQSPLPLISLKPNLPPWFQEVVLKCLEVEPRQRYGTAAQLAFDLQHPQQIPLTDRALRRKAEGVGRRTRRWFRLLTTKPELEPSMSLQMTKAPIVALAVDLKAGPELTEALRNTAKALLELTPEARLACICILKTNRLGMDQLVDEQGDNLHAKQLVALQHWARSLQVGVERMSFHVLEAHDVAEGILHYADHNQVSHLIMGARASSSLRRHLGSVSSQVVAQAHCTVTVVREPMGK